MKKTFFISGIDTDSGKTYATGWLAAKWLTEGKNVITQKFIQTGCHGISEDIETHRKIMGIPLQEADMDGTTCPLVFSYPSSPHLASRIDGKTIDLSLVRQSTAKLREQYDIVLLEGAGGLMVPITEDILTIDYIIEEQLPLIFVTSAKLGSINHTLLALNTCLQRGVKLEYLIFNGYPEADTILADDTRHYLQRYLSKNFPSAQWLDLPLSPAAF